MTCVKNLLSCIDNRLYRYCTYYYRDLDLRKERCFYGNTTIELLSAFLSSATHYVSYCHTCDADAHESILELQAESNQWSNGTLNELWGNHAGTHLSVSPEAIGKIYNDQTQSWSNYGGTDYTTPTDVTYPDNPDTYTIYFTNNAGWSGTIYCSYWGGSSGNGFPGTAMTLVSGVTYKFNVPKDATYMLFTNGSSAAQPKVRQI